MKNLQSFRTTLANMEPPSKTPCFDKGQEEHLRVQPTLSVMEEHDTLDDGTTTPKSPVAPFPISKDAMEVALISAVATGSASDESSSDDDDHMADKASKAKNTVSKGGGGGKLPILRKSEKVGDEQDNNDEGDDENDEENDDENDDENDEVDIKKSAPTTKMTKSVKDDKAMQAVKVVKDLLAMVTPKNPKVAPVKTSAQKKKKVAESEDDEESEKSDSGEDDDQSDENDVGSDDDDDATEKKKPVSKKQASKTAPKSNTIAQMQQKKLAMNATTTKPAPKTDTKTAPKTAPKTLASGLADKPKATVPRVKKDGKSKDVVVPAMAKAFGRGIGPSTQVPKKATVDKKTSSDASVSKKKRGREEIAVDTATNNVKCAKLERDIELMVLSVKSRSAALEKAEKELENAEIDE